MPELNRPRAFTAAAIAIPLAIGVAVFAGTRAGASNVPDAAATPAPVVTIAPGLPLPVPGIISEPVTPANPGELPSGITAPPVNAPATDTPEAAETADDAHSAEQYLPEPFVYDDVEYTLTDYAAQAPANSTRATVTRVIDGDTIEVNYGGRTERVRLVGIDTPERGTAGFNEATSFTRNAISNSGKVVYLQRSGDNRDRFDRLRRNVWVDTGSGFALLNDMLLESGHARIFLVRR